MKENEKISRKQFLGLVGGAAIALVAGRVAGMIESTSAIANIKNADTNAYGKFPYGGVKV